MAYLQFFPEEFIQLQQEVLKHPVLMNRLAKHSDVDAELQFAKMIAEIAAYCNVALDDDYDEKHLIRVAGVLIERLRKLSTAIYATERSDMKLVDRNGYPIVVGENAGKPDKTIH